MKIMKSFRPILNDKLYKLLIAFQFVYLFAILLIYFLIFNKKKNYAVLL